MTITDVTAHFSIHIHPGERSIRVAGEFDVATASQFTTAVEALQRTGAGDIDLDLHEVTFLDAAALGAVVAACAAQVVQGHSLTVRGVGAAQRRIFDLGGLGHLLTTHQWAQAAFFGEEAALPLSA